MDFFTDCGALGAPANGAVDNAPGTTYGEIATYWDPSSKLVCLSLICVAQIYAWPKVIALNLFNIGKLSFII